MAKKSSTPKKDKTEEKDNVPSAPPIFDVSKPGKTAAAPTSKPVIVGHKAMVKNDPMVSNPDEPENEKEEKIEVRHKRETTIKPINITSEEKPEPETLEANDEEAKGSDKQEAAENKASEPKDNDSTGKKPEEDGEQPETSTSGAIDALAGEASAKRQSQKEKEAEEKKKQAVQELIKSEKYRLPIHDAVYRRTSAFTLFVNLLLVILVILAGVVLAQDAGYIDIGLVLPFDLIK